MGNEFLNRGNKSLIDRTTMPGRSVTIKSPCQKLHYGLLVFLLTFLVSIGVAADQGGRHFEALKLKLVKDGFGEDRINAAYNHRSVRFDPASVAFFFVYKEAHLNYDQFAAPRQIKKARQYMQAQAASLLKAEKEFGVEKEIITAIILVETRLGTYTGESRILKTLSTVAALSESILRDKLWAEISKTKKISRKGFEKKADRKSKWAYKELKAFLRYTADERMNPVEIRGSFAGALGISQFLPSSVLMYGKDGNGDGRVNLFEHADAIASIANYLKKYGWRPGIDRDRAYKVVWRYNHSKYYVDIVLKVAQLLKG